MLQRWLRHGAVWSQGPVWAIGLILLVAYTVSYLGYPKLPGNDPVHPLGWWGWFDQYQSLRSTAAFVSGNLNPAEHHYPPGYSLLGVPFFLVMPKHPFFFVDLLSLLGAFAGFVSFGRRIGVPGPIVAGLFAASMLLDGTLLLQWVVPWNTTPTGAFIWLLLANVAAWIDGDRRPGLIGVLTGAVVACRPSDGVILLPCLATLAWTERRAWRAHLPRAARLGAGAACVVLPVVALHLAIFGAAPSPYMISSGQIGFTLHDFGWKAYVLLIDPFPWFADGEGLLQHAHWMALGLAGVIPALLAGPKRRMLAAVLLTHALLYISYVDLLPTGLWRFMNIHYFLWAIPGYGLLAWCLLQDLLAPARVRTRALAGASVVATLLVLSLRVVPAPVGPDRPAKAIDFAGPAAPFWDTFLGGRLALRDADGVMREGHDIRGFLYPGGVRVIGLRRDLVGAVEWLPGGAPIGYEGSQPSARWVPSLRLSWPPRWLRQAPPPGIPLPVS